MVRIVVYAATSALSALMCITCLFGTLVMLMTHHPLLALLLLVAVVPLAALARAADQLKSRALCGSRRGHPRVQRRLHAPSPWIQARQEVALYQRLTRSLPPRPAHAKPEPAAVEDDVLDRRDQPVDAVLGPHSRVTIW